MSLSQCQNISWEVKERAIVVLSANLIQSDTQFAKLRCEGKKVLKKKSSFLFSIFQWCFLGVVHVTMALLSNFGCVFSPAFVCTMYVHQVLG